MVGCEQKPNSRLFLENSRLLGIPDREPTLVRDASTHVAHKEDGERDWGERSGMAEGNMVEKDTYDSQSHAVSHSSLRAILCDPSEYLPFFSTRYDLADTRLLNALFQKCGAGGSFIKDMKSYCGTLRMTLLVFLIGIMIPNIQALDNSSPYSEELAKKLLTYSTVSYCMNESLVQSWTCGACYEDLYFCNRSIIEDTNTDTFAYIGSTRFSGKHSIVMAFRGTLPQDLKNLLVDIKIAPTMTDHIAPGSYVHSGFWEAWNGLKVSLKHQLSTLMAYYKESSSCDPLFPEYPEMYFTGHSLGGALATLAIADLVAEGFINKSQHGIHLYTFGSPRVGDETFAHAVEDMLTGSWRLIHHRDPVPRSPPLYTPFWKYHHIGRAILYNHDHTSYEICENDGENTTCNPFWFPAALSDHYTYLKVDVGSWCDAAVPPKDVKYLFHQIIHRKFNGIFHRKFNRIFHGEFNGKFNRVFHHKATGDIIGDIIRDETSVESIRIGGPREPTGAKTNSVPLYIIASAAGVILMVIIGIAAFLFKREQRRSSYETIV
ncbi:hypothetical protein PROFUN_05231 [Planoprotostelium fungivorum]|uniref:Fungal lipase-type domain-containing protein n=1 Tax=Planoprotostelium fungivorum TaxID=1890364 RepID=A0A2P6NRK1_9EUKA|nr:hypothetical protein PROFUN_05231 [Planoprotostelium fungivorum]